jgi:hypothetical protein
MPPKLYHARPIVLRELTLLRALGASLRTANYRPGRLRHHMAMPLSHPAKPNAFALLPRNSETMAAPRLK